MLNFVATGQTVALGMAIFRFFKMAVATIVDYQNVDI